VHWPIRAEDLMERCDCNQECRLMRGELPKDQRCRNTKQCPRCRTEYFESGECDWCAIPLVPAWKGK
jgi:hypothetical protein